MTLLKKSFAKVNASHVIAVGLAVVAVLWIASGVVTGSAPTKTEADTATKKSLPPLVRVRDSEASEHERYITLFGRTEAVKSIDLVAETAGQVVERPVKKGDWVKKGTPILRISMDDRQARLKEAEAKIEYQRLAYDSAKKLSRKQFQTRIKVAEQLSQLEAAKAALASIKLDIRRTIVRAPIDGFVETLPASVGDYLKVGDSVAALVNLDPVRVVAQVSEIQVARIKTGDKAWSLLAGGLSREGEVRFISRMGKSETRTFRVEAWIDNPDGAIPEGLTAELRLRTGVTQAHRVSPAVLTLDDQGVIGVKAIDEQGRVAFHAAEVLEDTTAGMWLGGLPARLTLITVGQEFVRDGQKVRVKAEDGKS